MKITIWSDIRCPFCYVAKRRLENAISEFEHKEKVTLEWKSFELDPSLETNLNIDTLDHYISRGAIRQKITGLFNNTANMGKEIGIDFNFNDIVVANSFMAHKLVHASKKINKQNEAKELLLKAYFTDGKNIDDLNVLLKIGDELGFVQEELRTSLKENTFDNRVREDQKMAAELGISGVPFFVFNDQHAFSGAQSEQVFLDTLKKAFIN
ncbi:DsbA family oxidoreductase [Crocinitomix catalasitica]|uniref:DsbA family oxidoreductase n=1 Tax=Crocinitomix catalasitica TaxID=184607 RepID=UPI000486DF15|nr:DsbA family oxidoreductase [Crocinitomix catalasitica]